MPVSISRWYRDLQKKQVLFIGIGVSHTRLIEKFLEKGISVTVCDKRSPEQLGEDYERLSALGAKFRLPGRLTGRRRDFPHPGDVLPLPRFAGGPEGREGSHLRNGVLL